MKESITKFDLEAAFKALDEIDTPSNAKGLKANKPALTEIFSNKSKFDALFEDYYDISNTAELTDAKDDRAAEVAKAKLARIEKIVDLDADSPDDLLLSYVGKYIVQCPQCMTLFYKNPEDVEESEDDPTIVNINEVCQHCGNESGYTLIGKVGAADEPEEEATEEETTEGELEADEMDTETAEENNEEETSEEIDEEAAETTEEEDFDLDSELAALDLDEEEEEEKQEESLFAVRNFDTLLEKLEESPDLSISSSDFEALLNSPEFKQPISDSETRNLLKNIGESTETQLFADEDAEGLIEDVDINNKTFRFAVVNMDGTFAGAPCVSEEEARELANQKEGRIIVKLDDADIEALTEGGLGLLGKTIGKKLKQTGQNIKNKVSGAIDKFAEKTMTREEKADWILANAKVNYDNVEFGSDGEIVHDDGNQRFECFLIVGYTNKYINGKVITMSPKYGKGDLVVAMTEPQKAENYKNADNIAQGWSKQQGNGPAIIFLAKDENDKSGAFLCQYFEGEIDKSQDKLEEYFTTVKKSLEGSKQRADGGDTSRNADASKVRASELKKGMTIVVDDSKEPPITAEITDIKKATSGLSAGSFEITVKLPDGKTKEFSGVSPDTMITIVKAKNEGLNTFVSGLKDLQESSLEALITKSLVESYGNVMNFKIDDCQYLNEKFTVNGTITFKSGNTRTVTYSFTEAYVSDKKATLTGINEKLGEDKQFSLIGSTRNNTFIAESFTCTKK